MNNGVNAVVVCVWFSLNLRLKAQVIGESYLNSPVVYGWEK